MRTNEVNLESSPFFLGNNFICEVTEASIDAVDNSIFIRHHLGNDGPALLHPVPGFFGQVDFEVGCDNVIDYLSG